MSLLDTMTELPAERKAKRAGIEKIWREIADKDSDIGLVATPEQWALLEALFDAGRETFTYAPRSLDEDYDAGLIKLLAKAEGAIEMSDEERFHLWKEEDQRRERSFNTDTVGYMIEVGSIADMPVTLSLTGVEWEGHFFIIYDMPSTIVDHRMGRRWLEENLPPSAFESTDRLNHSNAANACNVLFSAQRRAKAAA